MPLPADALIVPEGEIDPAWFPHEPGPDFRARLKGYLNEGYSQAAQLPAAEQDAAARAYAYFRTYDALCKHLALSPASVTFGSEGGGHTFTQDQRSIVCGAAKGYGAEWERRIRPAAVPARPASRTSQVNYSW